MKYSYYYWVMRKDALSGESFDTKIFLTQRDCEEGFIKLLHDFGYQGNIPTMHWEREPDGVFEGVLVCQLIFDGAYYEIRQISVSAA